MKFSFALLFCLFSLVACASDYKYADKDGGKNNVVMQFIDAETQKPIQGAYVNVLWLKKGERNSQCIRAALLRSDVNGWVRMKGPTKPRDLYMTIPNIMVPGYERFQYEYKQPIDPEHVVHIIREEPSAAARYPAWAKNLEALGYVYKNIGKGAYYNGYYKTFSPENFRDNASDILYPQQYYVTYRAMPDNNVDGIRQVADGCGDEGENIGLSPAEKAETGTRRALLQVGRLCDEKWDTAEKGVMDLNALGNSLWLIRPPPENAWDQFKKVLPNFPLDGLEGRHFTKEERLAYCAWMQPFVEKYK